VTLDTVFSDLILSSPEFQKAMPEMYRTYYNQRGPRCSYIEFSNGHYEYNSQQTRSWPPLIKHKADEQLIFNQAINPTQKISGVHQGIDFGQKTLPIDTYFSTYTSLFCKNTLDQKELELLIPGLRFIGNNYIIFEMPPTQKVIDYKEAYREDDSALDRQFYIPIPWQIYIAIYDPATMRLLSVQMYFTNTPLTSFDQTIYLPPILNFYASGALCRPFFETIEDIEKYPQNITGIFASAYDWVWNSGYNFDIVEPISEFICSSKFDDFLNLIPDTEENILLKYNLKKVIFSSNRLSPLHVRSFFLLWQQLSLYEVTNLKWTSFSIDTDFFNGVSSENYDQELFENFLTVHNLILVDEYDEDHDPDEDNYIVYDDVLQNYTYRRSLHNKIVSVERNLLDALRVSERFMSSNRISKQIFENTISFRLLMNNILSKIPCMV